MIQSIDEFIIRCVEAVVNWLNDWLSISQRRVEYALVFVFIVCWATDDFVMKRWWMLFFDGILGISNALIIDFSSQMRQKERINFNKRFWRLIMVVTFVTGPFWSAAAIHRYHLSKEVYLLDVGWGAFTLFRYVHVTNVSGERGRKRKASLAKLKELFGLEWLPKPERVPS